MRLIEALFFIFLTIQVRSMENDNHDEYDDEAFIEENQVETEEEYGESTLDLVEPGFTNRSLPQTRIFDTLLQSFAPNYSPQAFNDPFDFLRDFYPLPAEILIYKKLNYFDANTILKCPIQKQSILTRMLRIPVHGRLFTDSPTGYKSPLAEYDYIIIGAGSAGSALASRLTESKTKPMVLLIEAGKPEMITTDVPAISQYFQRTDYATPYYMEQHPGVCLGMENQRCYWPRGRAVGGTSVINYMIYTRGRPQEWDRIAADGNYGWSYSDVLKYYKKLEKSDLPGFDHANHRGRDGKVRIQFVPYRTKLANAFLKAGRLLGYPTIDYNAPETLGFGYVQSTTYDGRRYSAAKAYLHPHKKRHNLHILPYTTATKILIDPYTKEAYGVEYVRNHLRYTVRARREVILSAGPIASPQLLMLSGIGPQSQLQDLGIRVIKDLPVGQKLYDHICFPGVIFTLNTTNVAINEVRSINLRNLLQWLQFGDSVFSSIGGVEAIGYIKTPNSDEPASIPDIELIALAGSIVSDGGVGGSGAIRKGMKITDNVYFSAFGAIDGQQTWSAFPTLLHPKSYGYLELKDTSIFSHPRLNGKYLSHPKDVETFISSIRQLIEIGESEPFKKFNAKLYNAEYPTCKKYPFNTDKYWECAVRTLTVTLHHQIATCKMGPNTDKTAVVDPELRVHGVKRLRVVDTSVIPRTTSAHTNAPGMMIGEKAADLIKATWGDM